MSDLSALRRRASETKETLQRKKVERIKGAVSSVVNSDVFELTILDKMGKQADEAGARQAFINKVADEVCTTVMDPRNAFIDNCKIRGLSDHKIEKAVESLYDMFIDGGSQTYDEKLLAVATYIEANEHLYNDIKLLV